MKRYNPSAIEPKWQKVWAESGIYQAKDTSSQRKNYILDFFPYPSGTAMHVGHVRNYTISDVMARYARMRGDNVLHPMGWDAFGLPAENFAIKTGISPQQAVAENTGKFKQQLMQMGIGIDWSREINSSDPSYYKWTQWFFKLLFERGLAYQKESLQWWCPFDKTVLANEQVEAGKCWRCGNEVTKKPLKQWFFKITDYADRLLEDLGDLDWSDAIKAMQRNWIGRKKGIDITYHITNATKQASITTFTTHPDTNFGATFIVVAPEHPFVQDVIDGVLTPAKARSQAKEVEAYKKKALAKSDIERQEEGRKKTGVFTGLYAKNTLTGHDMPIWVSDFVLMGFGTGAVVGVPAHDTRDFQFAKTFDIPIVEVVEPVTGTPQDNPEFRRSIVVIVHNPKTGKILTVNWGKQNGGYLFVGGGREEHENIEEAAKREIAEETGYTHIKLVAKTGRIHHHYFAHSKGVARQIEAHALLFELTDAAKKEPRLQPDEKGKFDVEWLPKNEVESKVGDELHALAYDLLVRGNCYTGEGVMINSGKYNGLPTYEVREKLSEDLVNTGHAEWRVNYKIRDWLISRQRYWGAPIPIVHCPTDGAVAVPESQLPVELPAMKSYEPSGDGRSPLARVPEWVHTTCPKCGGPAERETDTMDGFACSSWYFLRFADPHNDAAPFDAAKAKYWLPVDTYVGGAEHAVMHLLYARFWTKVMYDADLIDFQEPFTALRNQGMLLAEDGTKFSKSKNNGIKPDDLIADGYGADAIRVVVLFLAPWNQKTPWSTAGLGGCFRFLQRVWAVSQEAITSKRVVNDAEQELLLRRATHTAIKKVTTDTENMSFNTAVAALMEYVNELYKIKVVLPPSLQNSAWAEAVSALAKLVAPYAPHMAEELWHELGNEGSVHISGWPVWDEALLQTSTVNIVVQVNGKVRAQLELPADASQQDIERDAKAHPHVQQYMEGHDVVRFVYVPGKLLNIVVK